MLTLLILIFAVATPICAVVVSFAAGRADNGYVFPIFGIKIPTGYPRW